MNAVRKLAHLPGNAITAFQRVKTSGRREWRMRSNKNVR